VVKAQPRRPVCQEEVFGPFVAVNTFKDEEAMALANSTEYGLGGGLWTTNLQRAHRVAGAMKAGMVWINCYKRVNPGSPFGGVGQFGIRSRDGLRSHARLHRCEVGVGERRRADSPALSAVTHAQLAGPS
jgi:acyl-CoA reductase-like NAD-dependent aldehyde dehydrogenase